MCDVCAFENIDSQKLNGKKAGVQTISKIYGARKDSVSSIKLCYIHDIQFFKQGESRFLQTHPKLLRKIGVTRDEIPLF